MSSGREGAGARACWFVGAVYDGSDDQTQRFLNEGIWENGYRDKHLDMVKSIQVGDRIAIKSSYTRKHNLPFDNRGQIVSVMAIKAVGTVRENLGDGRTLRVEWRPVDPPREWYFYTNRTTIWRVLPGDWTTDALVGFAFDGKTQDLGRFRNAPYWRERFGNITGDRKRFEWTKFYEAVADKLLEFKGRRDDLVAGIHSLASRVEGLTNLQDQFADGTTGPLRDICPFTVMGVFNRGITVANRKIIAQEVATLLGVTETVPESFEGIPVLNNQRSWFFSFDSKRQPDDIDALWEMFYQAISFTEADDVDTRSAFVVAYDEVMQRYGVGWNLTMGLYWIRPWCFPTLDGQSQRYIKRTLNIQIGLNGPKGRCNANDYLTVLDTLEARFREEAFPVHSFPELSQAAWLFKGTIPAPPTHPRAIVPEDEEDGDSEQETAVPPIQPYSVDDIMADGCFMDRPQIEEILGCFREKKNLILQGPPGTGKTWLAKRLAYALMGQRDDRRARVLQFHPNLSYEDFVRGWRPAGDGKLLLVDGPFIEMVKAAAVEPIARHVVVIEEINRGNPAQIFGEMLTLLEADKRTPNSAVELCFRRGDNERVYIPDNLYLIGTMNIADRSLALVDLALRRRFAFIDLVPTLGRPWRNWVHSQCGIDSDILVEIERRVNSLNDQISDDTGLGPQFRVGQSYVTPASGKPISDAKEWFRRVVETEIGPLLDEYWFDGREKAQQARRQLLEGF